MAAVHHCSTHFMISSLVFFLSLHLICSISSNLANSSTPIITSPNSIGQQQSISIETNTNNKQLTNTLRRALQSTAEEPVTSSQNQLQLANSSPAEEESSTQQQKQLRRRRRKNKDNISNIRNNRKRRNKSLGSPERQALTLWANSLTEQDYNHSHWRNMFHSRSSSDFFNGYARRISDTFKRVNAKVNFAMVGACDGTGDNTIKHLYLPNNHWRGVFVEPMSINVRDLIRYMSEKNAAHRSLIIRAAATSFCKNATLMVERPLYEEKNDSSIPHWLRRQIGSVLPTHRNHARKEWTLEEVRCVTAEDILRDWAANSASAILEQAKESIGDAGDGSGGVSEETRQVRAMRNEQRRAKYRRPHILKIDVEGHDFEVLMGFLSHNTPASQLPLIVDFEAKSIAKKYPLAKERMEYLGYVVTPFGQDGFALLKAERVLEGLVDQQDYFPGDQEPDV